MTDIGISDETCSQEVYYHDYPNLVLQRGVKTLKRITIYNKYMIS